MLCALLSTFGVRPRAYAAPGGLRLLDEACPEEFSLLGTVRGLEGSRSARVVFNHTGDSRFLFLELTGQQATLGKVKDGAATTLASAALPEGSGGTPRFSLKRRQWRITLIVNGRVIARAYDRELSGGRAGWRAAEGVAVDLRLQATEPVAFADDFSRGAGEAGQWDVAAGQCQVAEIAVGRHEGAAGRYSSNAFSWVVRAKPLALCTAGYWFWDDYAADVSVKPEERGAIGIAAYVQDPANMLLFRWTAAAPGQPGSGAAEIVQVQQGKAAVLASRPGGYEPGQWYRLRFIVRDGDLAAFIDGRPACRARDDAFGQGKMGLYARDCGRAAFDDVSVTAVDGLQDGFGADEPGRWEDVCGTWRTDAASHCRRTVAAGEAITVTGRPDWSGGDLSAEAAPGEAGEVGLVFAHRGPGDYILFRVGAGAGKTALIRVSGGKRAVLAESEEPVRIGKGAPLRVDAAAGLIKAYVAGRLAVAAAVSCPPGRVGFYAGGAAGARFSDLAVSFPVPDPPAPRIEAQFAQEDTMVGWATQRGSWSPDGAGIFWHTGEFMGDARASIDLPAGAFQGTLVLHADGPAPDTGYRLDAQLVAGGRSRLELRRLGKSVQSADWDSPGDQPRQLRLWREGDLVVGAVGDTAAVCLRDPQPLEGTRVGIRSGRPDVGVAAMDAAGSSVLDCLFAGPPTEWWAGRGVWDVAQRWPCDDRWSFFGGLRSDSPMLWTKRAFSGDITAEAWVALYMDAPNDQQIGYSHPSDLNLSFCTDGKDVSSGYTFQFAACSNTVTRILRREQIVSENRKVLMQNPSRLNLAFQRHWFHLRAEKKGGRIRFYVDGELAGEYTDPDPLRGGQVALWTWRNGLMVARARIWYEKDAGYVSLPVPGASPAPANPGAWKVLRASPVVVASDFERGTDGWAAGEGGDAPILALAGGGAGGSQSLRVVNRVSGGDLSAWCGARQFDAVKFPVLQFDYRVPKGVRLNLYLRLNRLPLFVGLTAPDVIDRATPSLGQVAGFTADGRWHTARFDLLAALRRLYPALAQLPVEDLHFRSPDAEYLRSGFGGNRWGAEYGLDNFRLVGAPATTAEDAKAVVMRK